MDQCLPLITYYPTNTWSILYEKLQILYFLEILYFYLPCMKCWLYSENPLKDRTMHCFKFFSFGENVWLNHLWKVSRALNDWNLFVFVSAGRNNRLFRRLCVHLSCTFPQMPSETAKIFVFWNNWELFHDPLSASHRDSRTIYNKCVLIIWLAASEQLRLGGPRSMEPSCPAPLSIHSLLQPQPLRFVGPHRTIFIISPLTVTTASYWIMYPSLHRALRCWQKYVTITRCVSRVLNILTWLPEARPAHAVRATTLYLLLGGGETQGNEFRKDSDPPHVFHIFVIIQSLTFWLSTRQSTPRDKIERKSWTYYSDPFLRHLKFIRYLQCLLIISEMFPRLDLFILGHVLYIDLIVAARERREGEYRGITVNCLACRVEPGTCCSRHIHPNGISSGHQSCAYIP